MRRTPKSTTINLRDLDSKLAEAAREKEAQVRQAASFGTTASAAAATAARVAAAEKAASGIGQPAVDALLLDQRADDAIRAQLKSERTGIRKLAGTQTTFLFPLLVFPPDNVDNPTGRTFWHHQRSTP